MSGTLPYGVSGEKEQADAYFSDLLSYRWVGMRIVQDIINISTGVVLSTDSEN